MGASAADLKLTIHAHPTLSETVMEAAEVFFGESTHVFKPEEAIGSGSRLRALGKTLELVTRRSCLSLEP